MYKAFTYTSSDPTTYTNDVIQHGLEGVGMVRDINYTDTDNYMKFWLPNCVDEYYLLTKSGSKQCYIYKYVDGTSDELIYNIMNSGSAKMTAMSLALPNNGYCFGFDTNSTVPSYMVIDFIKFYEPSLDKMIMMYPFGSNHQYHQNTFRMDIDGVTVYSGNKTNNGTPYRLQSKIAIIPYDNGIQEFEGLYITLVDNQTNGVPFEVVIEGVSYLITGNYISGTTYGHFAVPLSTELTPPNS